MYDKSVCVLNVIKSPILGTTIVEDEVAENKVERPLDPEVPDDPEVPEDPEVPLSPEVPLVPEVPEEPVGPADVPLIGIPLKYNWSS
jgi:hypothetical protein